MKTLSGTLTSEIASAQSGWCECIIIQLKSAITTPFGSTSVLRVTSNPAGLTLDGNTYTFWPFKRDVIRGDRKTTNDKLTIAFSNVTGEWATMLDSVDWSDVPIMIYKVALSASNDFITIFEGLIDSAAVTLETIQFTVSNSLGTLSTIAPRENMHQNCRFAWADDQCTALRFRTENYKAKTLDASCTTTRLKDTGFTEDTGTAASYGTDLVNALADAAITASDEDIGYVNKAVTALASDNRLKFTTAGTITQWEPFVLNTTGTMPSPLISGTTYYARDITRYTSGDFFRAAAAPNGAAINLTTNGSGVRLTSINHEGYGVKSSNDGYWSLPGNSDWGTLSHAYWQIPDAQAGLANAALTPYIQFDFGSAKTPRLWRLSNIEAAKLEDLCRLVVFFSSPDAATWTHEGYFEIPPVGGTLHECLIPSASSARYWRICIRSKWATAFSAVMLAEVQAYEESRHWWRGGSVKFDAGTSTVALRNVVRPVLESYSGEVVVPLLPVAPAAGDTLIIERGCNRTFNACCERRNTENFGGFTDLPNQTIVR